MNSGTPKLKRNITMSDTPKILVTKDYDRFKFRDDNRKVTGKHVAQMVDSISRYDNTHLKPIIVNQDMEVIDGQNRFFALMELQKPIYYVIDYDYVPEKMILLNSVQKNWKNEDYMRFWIEHGSQEYQELERIHLETEVKHVCLYLWFSVNMNDHKGFKEGKFKIDRSIELNEAFQNMLKFIDLITDNETQKKALKNRKSFTVSCKRFFMDKNVNSKLFFDKLEVYPISIKILDSTQGYLEQFVKIYNWRRNGKDSRYLVIQYTGGKYYIHRPNVSS